LLGIFAERSFEPNRKLALSVAACPRSGAPPNYTNNKKKKSPPPSRRPPLASPFLSPRLRARPEKKKKNQKNRKKKPKQQPNKTTMPTVGIGLSGAGFLLFFLIGALSTLEEAGIVRPPGPNIPLENSTLFAGSSAGSILAVSSCLGISTTVILRESHRLADFCAAHNDCALSLDAELRRTLEKALAEIKRGDGANSVGPDGVARAVERCRGRAFVNLSVLFPAKTSERPEELIAPPDLRRLGRSRNLTSAARRSNANALSEIGLEHRPGAVHCELAALAVPEPLLAATQHVSPPGLRLYPEPWLVSDWRDGADAIDAVAASSHNILLSGLAPTTAFRGRQLVADGVYTVPLPVPPIPPRLPTDRLIKISAVPDGYSLAPGSPPISGADIWPGKRTEGELPAGMTVAQYLCHAAVVADFETREAMVELGRREAALYLEEVRQWERRR
jgi:hypothetical protein